jgi:hypothetical protein
MMGRPAWWIVLAGASLGSCSDTTGACPPRTPRAAIDVEIREAGTGLPLAASARGVVRDGSYADSLVPGRREGDVLVSRQAAFERAGTYAIEVVALGYGTWQQSGVVAREGTCGVTPVVLQATLQPASLAGYASRRW